MKRLPELAAVFALFATLHGKIRGYGSAEYTLHLERGQAVTVALKSGSTFNYFNIYAPGADEAFFIGSRDGNRFQGSVTASGDYRIQVYLMRNAARRGASASFELTVAPQD
jgi:hypothetical protein